MSFIIAQCSPLILVMSIHKICIQGLYSSHNHTVISHKLVWYLLRYLGAVPYLQNSLRPGAFIKGARGSHVLE